MAMLRKYAIASSALALAAWAWTGPASASPLSIPPPLAADVYNITVTQQNGPGGVTNRVEDTTNFIGPGGPQNYLGGSCNGALPSSCSSLSAAGIAQGAVTARAPGSVEPSVNPSLSVSANSTGGLVADSAGRLVDHDEAFAYARLTYYFVISPSSNILSQNPNVPVYFDGRIESSGSQSDATSLSSASSNGYGQVFLVDSQNKLLFQKTDDGLFDEEFDLEVGTLYSITYIASASSSAGGAIARALIDPTLTLAPEIAANYHIDYSPNLFASASAAPEPSTATPTA